MYTHTYICIYETPQDDMIPKGNVFLSQVAVNPAGK